MQIKFGTHKSTSYVCTLDATKKKDIKLLNEIRDAVKLENKTADQKRRVVVRGRKPFVKQVVYDVGPNPVSYDLGGNIVGGLANASYFDVYVYDRY